MGVLYGMKSKTAEDICVYFDMHAVCVGFMESKKGFSIDIESVYYPRRGFKCKEKPGKWYYNSFMLHCKRPPVEVRDFFKQIDKEFKVAESRLEEYIMEKIWLFFFENSDSYYLEGVKKPLNRNNATRKHFRYAKLSPSLTGPYLG